MSEDDGLEAEDESRGASELDLPTYSEHWGARPRTTADMTPGEKQYNRLVYGLTYSERYGIKGATCADYCLRFDPDIDKPRNGARCSHCYGRVEIRSFEGSEIEPGPGRAKRLAAWIGGCAGAFCDALMFPFRVGRAHTEAMVRDILREMTFESDVLADILQVLEGIEGEMQAIRNTADAAGGQR